MKHCTEGDTPEEVQNSHEAIKAKDMCSKFNGRFTWTEVFQLDSLPYEEPNWFVSDLTIDEVEV